MLIHIVLINNDHCVVYSIYGYDFQSYIEDDGQHCTPLIVAARHGSHAVVKIIVSKFNVDLEKEGTVKFDGFVIEGASALWCAAGGGK